MQTLMVVLVAVALSSCKTVANTSETKSEPPIILISQEEALRIAAVDASSHGFDSSLYNVLSRLDADGWHVDYVFKKREMLGGGPHYIIDRKSGRITYKIYYQ